MKFVYSCFILVFITQASTDILITSDGPVVGWANSEYTAYLMKPGSSAVPRQIGQGYSQLSLSLCEDTDTEPVLLVAAKSYSDWHFRVESYTPVGLELLIQQELDPDDFTPPVYCTESYLPALSRYISTAAQRLAVINLNTAYTDIQDERYITACSVSPWSSTLIDPADTTNWITARASYLYQVTNFVFSESISPILLQTGATYSLMGFAEFDVSTVFFNLRRV